MKNLGLDFGLLILHDKIDKDKCEILNFLDELEYLNINKQVTEHIILLSLNHISLCELTLSIKEYFILKKLFLI